jgi:hypothetical protein
MEEDFARSIEGRGQYKAAVAIVERGNAQRRQQYGRCGFLFDRLQTLAWREGAQDTVVVDEYGGVAGSCLAGG